MITIRKAQPGDEYAIAHLAQQTHLGQIANAPEQSGFIIHVKKPEAFLQRIRHCSYFFVATKEQELVGYLLACTLEELASLDEEVSYLDELMRDTDNQSMIYLDQIVVSPHMTGQGIGQHLLDELNMNIGNRGMVCFIVHSPVRNERSISFFSSKNSWYLLREIVIEDMVCGLYGYAI